MTIEEKLQHFYTASIDSAMQEAQQVQTQHQEALDKIFQEHKETKERQIQSHIQAETDNLKREINKTVSARQLEYRRLLSDKTEEIKQQLFHDVAERLAQFRSTPEYLEYLSQRIQEACDFAGEDALVVYLDPADQNRIPELAARFMEHYNAGVPGCAVTAHAVDTLQTLARMGWQQAVLSASRRDYLIEQVSARGLQGFFTELLGLADIYGVSKVQLGTDYLRRTGIDPAHCVMIGDPQHDAEVAAAIGAKCVLYTGGHQSRALLEAACPHVIDDLALLPDLLESL